MKWLNLFLLVLVFIFPALAQRSPEVAPPKDLMKFLNLKTRDIRVRAADINGDNQPEYFVKQLRNCVGRCRTTLYQRRGEQFIELASGDGIWFDVSKESRDGMRTLVGYDYFDFVGDYVYTHYEWDGQDYVPAGCTRIIKSGKNKGKRENVQCSE